MYQRLAWQRRVRKWHNRIAVIGFLQLFAWTVSGIYFAFTDIDHVHGDDYRVASKETSIDFSTINLNTTFTGKLTVQERLPGEIIVGSKGQWQTTQGDPVRMLSQTQALSLGNAQTNLNLTVANLIESAEPTSEFRGRALPLWQLIDTEQPSVKVYLDAYSGSVSAIRNDAWRIWDFLWSLHIMDYSTRDEIGTVLLKIFSVLTLFTAVLGIALYLLIPKKR
jgi:uncharacterized iron-regulated membrane protein